MWSPSEQRVFQTLSNPQPKTVSSFRDNQTVKVVPGMINS